VTEEEFNTVQRLKDSTEAVAAITMTVAQTDGVKDKPKAKAETVESIEAEVDAIEPPKKLVSKKAPAVEEKLEDLVGEWDD
jgi:hypothetical protein